MKSPKPFVSSLGFNVH